MRIVHMTLLLSVAFCGFAHARHRKHVTKEFNTTQTILVPAPGAKCPDNTEDGGPGTAAPFPSTIHVAGLKHCVIKKVQVVLNKITHTFPSDMEIVLQGPCGQYVLLWESRAGGTAGSGGTGIQNVTVIYDDKAKEEIPLCNPFPSDQTWKPSASPLFEELGIELPGLEVFKGTCPNGDWKLYAYDTANEDSGSILGWSLLLTVECCGCRG